MTQASPRPMTSPSGSAAETARSLRTALLIDCDNTSARLMPEVFRFAVASGQLVFRYAYGDWASSNLSGWQDVMAQYGITPHQVMTYRKGKNSTDLRLVIDAMELCLTGRVESVCIVSGDSDFAPLAIRLKEHAIHVVGVSAGASYSEAFAAACDIFRPIEDPAESGAKAAPELTPEEGPEWVELVLEACEHTDSEDGWMQLGWGGQYIRRLQPSFDPKIFGFTRMSDLIASRPDLFEIEERGPFRDRWIRPTVKRTGKSPIGAPSSANGEQLEDDAIPWILLVEAVNKVSRDDGWSNAGTAWAAARAINPSLTCARYGFRRVIDLFASRDDLFSIEPDPTVPHVGPTTYLVQPKLSRSARRW